MNPSPDAVPGAAVEAQAGALTEASTRPFYWSVRRELWESRSITIAPLLVAGVVLLGSLISVIVTSHRLRALEAPGEAGRLAFVVKPFNVAPAPIMFATFLVGFIYALDALYGERRDRSLLFWKSLPVSDVTTVLAKASIPFVVLPLIAYVLSVVTQLVLLIPGALILRGSGVSAAGLWGEVRFFEGLVVMAYGLAAHVLWFAPIYGWLMLVSAWARRTPVLWAALPLLAIGALEHIVAGTSHFGAWLGYRLTGAMAEAFTPDARKGNVDRISQLDPAGFLDTPGLWLGLAAAAVCLALAVRLRRDREPI